MKYWDKIWPYFLLITCGADVIIMIYNGEVFSRIATIIFGIFLILFALAEIWTRHSQE